jgi:hypothetical protein
MATIFWDCQGILLADFKQRNTTVTGGILCVFNLQTEGWHQRETPNKAVTRSEVIAR